MNRLFSFFQDRHAGLGSILLLAIVLMCLIFTALIWQGVI